MEHEFWHERWAKSEIGFHEGAVNKFLQEHWAELAGNSTEAVLVPLCGKARDMWWLHDRGHPVIGVELSEIACKDFFTEAREKAHVSPGEPFTIFAHDGLELWCGDFFQLAAQELRHIRLVYDRAALIALPPAMRGKYVEHLAMIVPDGTRLFLVTLNYDADIKGPPFNVSNNEVQALYEADFETELLLTQTIADDHPFARRKGLKGATESVFLLTKRNTI